MTPEELKVLMDRVSKKTTRVFDKDLSAFTLVKTLMTESTSLEDYYTKFEAHLDTYLKDEVVKSDENISG